MTNSGFNNIEILNLAKNQRLSFNAIVSILLSWLPLTFCIANRLINLRNRMFVKSILPAITISGLIAFVLLIIKTLIKTSDLLLLLLSIVSGVTVYLIGLLIIKQILFNKKKTVLNL